MGYIRSTAATFAAIALLGCARDNPLFDLDVGGSGDGGMTNGRGDDDDADDADDVVDDGDDDDDDDDDADDDDDDDDVADSGGGCEPNAECTELPPGDWLGPVSFVPAGAAANDPCAGPYSELVRRASTGDLPAAPVPCCECMPIAPDCSSPVRVLSTVPDTCAAEIVSDFGDGQTCMNHNQLPILGATELAGQVDVEVAPQCAAFTPGSEAPGLDRARVCGGDGPLSSCAAGVCVPTPSPGEQLCLYTMSDAQCPADWEQRYELFQPLAPDCGECSCGVSGGGCVAEMQPYGLADCNDPMPTGMFVGCNPVSDFEITGAESHRIGADAIPPSCNPVPSGAATSPVVQDALWTMCCRDG